jgi:hypothetical protein
VEGLPEGDFLQEMIWGFWNKNTKRKGEKRKKQGICKKPRDFPILSDRID